MQTWRATVVLVALAASAHAEPAKRTYSQAMAEGVDTELPRPDICDSLLIAGKHTLTF